MLFYLELLLSSNVELLITQSRPAILSFLIIWNMYNLYAWLSRHTWWQKQEEVIWFTIPNRMLMAVWIKKILLHLLRSSSLIVEGNHTRRHVFKLKDLNDNVSSVTFLFVLNIIKYIVLCFLHVVSEPLPQFVCI